MFIRKSKKIGVMFVIMLLTLMVSALALDFNVDCPVQTQESTSFDCTISMPQPPASGLNGLSFTISPSDAQVTDVSFGNSLTDISSGGTYGFFSINPYTSTDPFVTITLSPASENDITLKVDGVSGSLGDGTSLQSSELTFNEEVITLETSSLCGNGVIDSGEQCDGRELGGATCKSVLGTNYEGTLSCDNSCSFDTTGCTTIDSTTNGCDTPGTACATVLSNIGTCLSGSNSRLEKISCIAGWLSEYFTSNS